jgi:hypothetical protein
MPAVSAEHRDQCVTLRGDTPGHAVSGTTTESGATRRRARAFSLAEAERRRPSRLNLVAVVVARVAVVVVAST